MIKKEYIPICFPWTEVGHSVLGLALVSSREQAVRVRERGATQPRRSARPGVGEGDVPQALALSVFKHIWPTGTLRTGRSRFVQLSSSHFDRYSRKNEFAGIPTQARGKLDERLATQRFEKGGAREQEMT